MPFLKEQIEIVNATLRAGALKDKRFQSGRFEAIAVDVSRITADDKVEMFPAVMDGHFEVKEIVVNDTYPITVYHKVLGKTYGRQAIQPQYGDGYNAVTERVEMKMVVSGNVQRLKLTAEQLEALVVTGFPDQISATLLSTLSLDSMSVAISGSNLVTAQVFSEEYRGQELFLAPEDILFSVRYAIESKFRKGCMTTGCGDICAPDVSFNFPCNTCDETQSLQIQGADTGTYVSSSLVGKEVLQVTTDGLVRNHNEDFSPWEVQFIASTGTLVFGSDINSSQLIQVLYK